MHLYKIGHQFSGYYYYNIYQAPVYFNGEDSSEKGTIKLASILPDPEISENFLIHIKDSTVSGEWHTTKDTKSLEFSARENKPSLRFDFLYLQDSTILKPAMTGSPLATYEAATVWPKGNSTQVNFLKRTINEEFGVKNSIEDIDKIFLRRKKSFFDGYLKSNVDVKIEDMQDPYIYSMEETGHLMIAFQSPKLLTLAFFSYSYAGGAHGNFGTSFSSLDMVKNKKLRLDDVITLAGKKQLPTLLEKYFRKTYGLKDSDSLSDGGLFENTIKPNSNFYVTAKGIGFNYEPYEIGPYALGEINIFIPFSELNGSLQPVFKKILE